MKRTRQRGFAPLAALAVLTLACLPAQAQWTLYTSRPAWEAAVAGLGLPLTPTFDFARPPDAYTKFPPPDDNLQLGVVYDGVHFKGGTIGSSHAGATWTGQFGVIGPRQAIRGPGLYLPLVIDFPSPTLAVGYDHIMLSDVLVNPNAPWLFSGYIFAAPRTTWSESNPGGSSNAVILDNFAVAAAVPEPGTLLLVIAAPLLAWRRRRA